MSEGVLEVAHELIQPLLMLCFAEAGQVRVESRRHGTLVAQIDLNLAEVFALLQEVSGVGMPIMPSSA